jgi:hypothetical protein
MTGDECDSPTCGLCHIDACDLCGEPVAFVDDEGEAWCMVCWDAYQAERNFAAFERELSAWHGGDDWQGGEAYRRQMREAGR